ncbi:MAG: hypothetical protein ACJA1Y_000358, partial [Burkholderiaceae bacterium]
SNKEPSYKNLTKDTTPTRPAMSKPPVTTIFGAVGDPRGDLVKHMPLARAATENRCKHGV